MSLFPFPVNPSQSLSPFVLSLSKCTSRLEASFDKLSANSFSRRELV